MDITVPVLWFLIVMSWVTFFCIPSRRKYFIGREELSASVVFFSLLATPVAMLLYRIEDYNGITLFYAFIAFPLMLIPTSWWQKTISIAACLLILEACMNPSACLIAGVAVLAIIAFIGAGKSKNPYGERWKREVHAGV